MNKDNLVKAVIQKLRGSLGRDVITDIQSLIPKLKKVRPENLNYFLNNFKEKHKLNDQQYAEVVKNLIKRYKFHSLSFDHMSLFKKIVKDNDYLDDIKL